MDKIKECENFDREDEIDKSLIKNKTIPKYHVSVKFLIIFIFLIISATIFLFSINSQIETKEKQITQLNVKTFLLSDVNQKNDRKMAEIYNILDKLDKELKYLEEDISSKDESLNKYQNLISELNMDNENIININQLESLKNLNSDKAEHVDDLLKKLRELKFQNSPFKEMLHSIIFDTTHELDYFKRRFHSIFFSYIYGINNGNTTGIVEKCENKTIHQQAGYIVVFQNDLFDRFGFYISNNQERRPIIFNLNELGRYCTFYTKDNILYIDDTAVENINISADQKNNLKFVIEIIEKMDKRNHYKNILQTKKDSSLNEMMEESDLTFNITELEIYNV